MTLETAAFARYFLFRLISNVTFTRLQTFQKACLFFLLIGSNQVLESFFWLNGGNSYKPHALRNDYFSMGKE